MTQSNLKLSGDIDKAIVIKIQNINDPNSGWSFIYELIVSLAINQIRESVPNYAFTYGGFVCGSPVDNSSICSLDGPINKSYILMENISPSKTFHSTLETEVHEQDILDTIYQVAVSLYFGNFYYNFTHYDLHNGNILLYDFLQGRPPVLFKYYIKGVEYVVPAKTISVLIDFGFAHMKGVRPTKEMKQHELRTSFVKNDTFDVFTFLIWITVDVLLGANKHLLVKKNGIRLTWRRDTRLAQLLIRFFESYTIWIDLNGMLNSLAVMSYERTSWRKMADVINNHINVNFRLGWGFVPKPNMPITGKQPLNTPSNLVDWLKRHFYSNIREQDYGKVYHWGSVPRQVQLGIQPSREIVDELRAKEQELTERTSSLRRALPEEVAMEVEVKEPEYVPMDID